MLGAVGLVSCCIHNRTLCCGVLSIKTAINVHGETGTMHCLLFGFIPCN